mmetsp:Transcript_20036/g.51227  ORF Transcript_20036/g.51227 Transcript_20036/m.51227 type:complete len:294 (+) Transcript_20036:791-1672(+)
MDFLGVRIVSIDSCNTFLTVLVMVVNLSVVLPTTDVRTESASFVATSAATFLAMRFVLKLARMGSRSCSVRTAPPVTFLKLLVNDLNKPPTRPVLSSASASASSSSASSPEDRDATSASFMNSCASSPVGRNSALDRSTSGSCSLSFEKSRAASSFLETLPPSQCRASLPFFGSLGGSSSFLLAALPLAAAPPPSPSSSSSSSPSLPPLTFFLGALLIPFSSLLFTTSLPFFVSANDRMACGRFASRASLSTFCRTFPNSASKSTCFIESPFPNASPMLFTNSLATLLRRLSR